MTKKNLNKIAKRAVSLATAGLSMAGAGFIASTVGLPVFVTWATLMATNALTTSIIGGGIISTGYIATIPLRNIKQLKNKEYKSLIATFTNDVDSVIDTTLYLIPKPKPDLEVLISQSQTENQELQAKITDLEYQIGESKETNSELDLELAKTKEELAKAEERLNIGIAYTGKYQDDRQHVGMAFTGNYEPVKKPKPVENNNSAFDLNSIDELLNTQTKVNNTSFDDLNNYSEIQTEPSQIKITIPEPMYIPRPRLQAKVNLIDQATKVISTEINKDSVNIEKILKDQLKITYGQASELAVELRQKGYISKPIKQGISDILI